MGNQRNLSDPIALRLPSEVLADIEAIARVCGRSRSWIMVRAMKAYLATEGREILDLDRARRSAAAEGATELDDLLVELDDNLPGNAA